METDYKGKSGIRVFEVETMADRQNVAGLRVGDLIHVTGRTGVIEVSGAGTEGVDGLYTFIGTFFGYPYYQHQTESFVILYDARWGLYTEVNGDLLYYDQDSSMQIYPVGLNWYTGINEDPPTSSGEEPAPSSEWSVTPCADEGFFEVIDTSSLSSESGYLYVNGRPVFVSQSQISAPVPSDTWTLMPCDSVVAGAPQSSILYGWKPDAPGTYLMVANAGLESPQAESRIIISIKKSNASDYVEIETTVPGATVSYGSIQGVQQIVITQSDVDDDVYMQAFIYSSENGMSIRDVSYLTFIQVSRLS